jgi:uncharacterized membrane protein YkoI
MTTRTLTLSVAVLALAVAGLSAADKKIQRKDLPPAVEKAVQLEETKGATVKGLAIEVEGGKKMYEVETTVNGYSRDLLFYATGRLVEAEEATTLDAVPAAVKAALEASGKVLMVETVTKGKTVTYEATVEKNGKKSEVAVGADGKRLKS